MSRKAQWPEFVWVRVPLGTKKDIKLSIEKLRSANINFAWTESEFIRSGGKNFSESKGWERFIV